LFGFDFFCIYPINCIVKLILGNFTPFRCVFEGGVLSIKDKMKMKGGLIYILIILSCFCSKCSLAQTQHKTFVFIEIPFFSKEKTLPYLIQRFSEENKIEVVGYCSNLGIVTLEMDVKLHDNEQELARCLKQLEMEFSFKTDISITKLEQICNSKYERIRITE